MKLSNNVPCLSAKDYEAILYNNYCRYRLYKFELCKIETTLSSTDSYMAPIWRNISS